MARQEDAPAAVDHACNVFASNQNKHAFTLVEILAVVVILDILAVVVVPHVFASSATAKINVCYRNKTAANAAAEKWYFDKGSWPADNLSDVSADANYRVRVGKAGTHLVRTPRTGDGRTGAECGQAQPGG